MREVIMSSKDGNFTLVSKEGTGMNNTPWKGLEVISDGLADKHVVEIRLRGSYNGNPVAYKYNEVYIAHGMRSVFDTLSDTMEYIKVLEEALDFAYRINSYIENNSEWKQ